MRLTKISGSRAVDCSVETPLRSRVERLGTGVDDRHIQTGPLAWRAPQILACSVARIVK